MSTCGEDEFGNLYANVLREDVGALRGCGSLYWSHEDDSDSYTSTKVHSDHLSEKCHTGAIKEHPHPKLVGDVGEQEMKFIHSETRNGVSPAQGFCKNDELKEITNSKNCLRDAKTAAPGAEDVDTESDDDLHIVLNPSGGVANEGRNEESEDGEDFVILAGRDAINDQDWQEELCTPLEDKSKVFFDEGEKLGALGDEKGKNRKSLAVQPRMGYGSQVYHRSYRYVRGSGPSSVGPCSVGPRVSARINGKFDRLSGWWGSTNCQKVSLMSRGTVTFRGLSCGLEYSIPSNKTVFDVDIDALKDKPWRLHHVDVSDYFNFGFDEISWKTYCKQLAQFCLEITTQSRISVYEGGRTEQSTTGVGGGTEPWSCAKTQGVQIRESDAICLIDVNDDRLSQSCSEDHVGHSGEVNSFLQKGSPRSDVCLENEGFIWKTAQPPLDNANQTSVTRLSAEPQKCGPGLGNETQINESVSICPGDVSPTQCAFRSKTLGPSTPPERIPTQDKRDTERGKSQSSSFNDGSQTALDGFVSGAFHRIANAERNENLQIIDNVKARGRCRVNAALKFCDGNCLSGSRDMKRCSSDVVNSLLSKKRRLGLRKVNYGAHHAVKVLKKSSGPGTSTASLGPYKATTKADISQQKRLISINSAGEHLNGDKLVGQYVKGSNEQHVAEKAEMKSISLSSKKERRKRHGETGSSKVKGRLHSIHCKSAKEKSKEKLKAKKHRNSCKCKERIKAKGCPTLETVQAEGPEKTFLVKKQGPGNMSMINFISKDNCFYWRKVDNMSMGDIQDQGTKMFKLCQYHKIEQKTESKNKNLKSDNFLLGHVEIGGDQEIKNEVLKLDGNTLEEAVISCKSSQVLKRKKMDLKNMLSKEHRVDLANTGLHLNPIFEAHARDSMHVAFSKQVGTRLERKAFENMGRHFEVKARGLTDLEVPRGQSCKKHHAKKLLKSSHRNYIQPCLARQEKQDDVTLNLDPVKDRALINCKTNSPLSCGRVVHTSGSNDKNRKVDSETCQSQMHSPKACGSRLSNFSTDTRNDNSHIGFDMSPNLRNGPTDIVNGNNYIGFDISKLHEVDSRAEDHLVEQESIHAILSESSEEEVKKRGRSKFERWTSHSEQVPHDSCFSISDMQKGGRICLSRKVPASKRRKYLKPPDESAPECMNQGDNCAAQSEAGKKWMAAREREGRTFIGTDNKSIMRKNEQQTVQQHVDQFLAKLEKRRERFKLPAMAEQQPLQIPAMKDPGESLRRSASKALQLTDSSNFHCKN